jgi:hypothetical protein
MADYTGSLKTNELLQCMGLGRLNLRQKRILNQGTQFEEWADDINLCYHRHIYAIDDKKIS